MDIVLTVVLRYVAPFLMGAGVAAMAVFADAASISATFAIASLWFLTTAMPVSR